VVLKTGKQLLISETELLDSKHWYVKRAFSNLNRIEKKKIDQKSIRLRKLLQADLENNLAMKARKERKEQDCEEFNRLMKMIANQLLLGSELTFHDFVLMVKRLRTPYKTKIEGHMITVTENKKSVMMKESALQAIKVTILGEKRDHEVDNTTTNKKAHTNRAAVNTVMGADGISALHNSHARNSRQNKEAQAKKITSLKTEMKTISKTLSMIVDRKARCEAEWAKQEQHRYPEAEAAVLVGGETTMRAHGSNDNDDEVLNLPGSEFMRAGGRDISENM
jgi:hypothetical protein